jgi:hypothetical protein
MVKSFVKGCIVFACINVLEKEKAKHLAAFGERKAWSSAGSKFKLSIDVGGGDTEDEEDTEGEGIEDIFNSASLKRESTMSLDDIYNPAPMSPLNAHLVSGPLDSPSMRSQEGQENFWAVVERVFHTKPKKAEEVEEIVVEEEVVRVKRIIVEPRIKYVARRGAKTRASGSEGRAKTRRGRAIIRASENGGLGCK